MSVNNTNSTKYLEFHGIKLAAGAQIANLVVEKLAAAPATLEAGRFWYNTTSNVFQFVRHDGSQLVTETAATVSELANSINEVNTKLASTVAGEGSALVGFSGLDLGSKSNITVPAGTVEDSIKTIITSVNNEITNRIEDVQNTRGALAAVTGATLVGYEGSTGVNGVIDVVAGTIKDSLDSLVDQVDSKFGELGNDSLSKTTLADQEVKSKVTFGSDVIIEGDINVLGERFIIEGNVVELGDNIILLNREVLATDTPVANAGLEVNRGSKGTLSFVTWDESAKEVVVPVVTVDKVTHEENVTQSRVINGIEFDDFFNWTSQAITDLTNEVSGKIGDLTTLATDDKSTIVAAINELHKDNQDDRDALAASTGSTLVGYKGKDSSNGLLKVVAGTVEASIDAVVEFVDAEAKAADDFAAALVSTEAGKGSSLVGFAGQGTVGTDKFALPAGSVNGSLQSVVTAVKEDREAIELLQNANDALKSAINAQSFKVVSASALTHTIVHNLGSLDVTVAVWFKDGAEWVNHQAYTKLVDANTVELTLTTAAEVKVLVKKFEDLI